ncbi:MAG: hypothetical protein MJ250_08070 [Alphaproteobacteria bacterium]|nr:hypothetical protein [Alphaproteobacteria bacterium]
MTKTEKNMIEETKNEELVELNDEELTTIDAGSVRAKKGVATRRRDYWS